MKNKSTKISANEINRFIYCPYQWYYNRYYGSKAIKDKYRALDIQSSDHEANFVKGQKFHKNYYRSYRLRRALQIILIVIFLFLLIWWVKK